MACNTYLSVNADGTVTVSPELLAIFPEITAEVVDGKLLVGGVWREEFLNVVGDNVFWSEGDSFRSHAILFTNNEASVDEIDPLLVRYVDNADEFLTVNCPIYSSDMSCVRDPLGRNLYFDYRQQLMDYAHGTMTLEALVDEVANIYSFFGEVVQTDKDTISACFSSKTSEDILKYINKNSKIYDTSKGTYNYDDIFGKTSVSHQNGNMFLDGDTGRTLSEEEKQLIVEKVESLDISYFMQLSCSEIEESNINTVTSNNDDFPINIWIQRNKNRVVIVYKYPQIEEERERIISSVGFALYILFKKINFSQSGINCIHFLGCDAYPLEKRYIMDERDCTVFELVFGALEALKKRLDFESQNVIEQGDDYTINTCSQLSFGVENVEIYVDPNIYFDFDYIRPNLDYIINLSVFNDIKVVHTNIFSRDIFFNSRNIEKIYISGGEAFIDGVVYGNMFLSPFAFVGTVSEKKVVKVLKSITAGAGKESIRAMSNGTIIIDDYTNGGGVAYGKNIISGRYHFMYAAYAAGCREFDMDGQRIDLCTLPIEDKTLRLYNMTMPDFTSVMYPTVAKLVYGHKDIYVGYEDYDISNSIGSSIPINYRRFFPFYAFNDVVYPRIDELIDDIVRLHPSKPYIRVLPEYSIRDVDKNRVETAVDCVVLTKEQLKAFHIPLHIDLIANACGSLKYKLEDLILGREDGNDSPAGGTVSYDTSNATIKYTITDIEGVVTETAPEIIVELPCTMHGDFSGITISSLYLKTIGTRFAGELINYVADGDGTIFYSENHGWIRTGDDGRNIYRTAVVKINLRDKYFERAELESYAEEMYLEIPPYNPLPQTGKDRVEYTVTGSADGSFDIDWVAYNQENEDITDMLTTFSIGGHFITDQIG